MDVETRRAFWADMRRSAADGRTILFATHYLEEADQVADRIIVLDHGRIVADGTGRSIRARVGDADDPLRPGRRRSTATGSPLSRASPTSRSTATPSAWPPPTPMPTVRELISLPDLPIHDLEVTGADLEDAFVALTSTTGAQEPPMTALTAARISATRPAPSARSSRSRSGAPSATGAT